MIWYDNLRIHLSCIHKRISCVYTRDLLCMHNTLVHALGQGAQGPGPKACRVSCMHKRSLVYTQEILLCIHNKSHKYTNFVINTHYLIFRRLFCWKITPRRVRCRASKVGWSYPITFRSLVVKHTAWTQNWSNFDTFVTFSNFLKNTICSQNDHISDLELSFTAPFSKPRCAAFPCSKETLIFIIF